MSPDFSEAPIVFMIPDSIVIPADRQRDKATADDSLMISIGQHGVLNPIIVRRGNILVAGERRLDACIRLNLPSIPVRNFEELSVENATLIELQENLARKQLTWQEEARAVSTFHSLKSTSFPGWTQYGTAEALGLSESAISMRLMVAGELADPAVSGCQTLSAAANYIQAKATRAIAAARAQGADFASAIGSIFDKSAGASPEDRTAALIAEATGQTPATPLTSSSDLVAVGKQAAQFLAAKKAETPADKLPSGPIICADFTQWVADYSGVPFDVIHCDFPYGKDYKGANTTKQAEHSQPIYDDSAEVMWKLIDAFLAHKDRICAPQCHVLFWHDVRHAPAIIKAFVDAGFRHCSPYPIIWTKGNAGAPGDYARNYRHCYETAHLFSLGDRRIIKMAQDHFPAPVDEDKLHLSQKPVPMLRHFLSALCDEHTRLLDPTCGSGSAIAAANQLGVDYALGVEFDENNAQIASFYVERRTKEG